MNNSITIIKGWKGYYTRPSALHKSKNQTYFTNICLNLDPQQKINIR